MKATFKELNEPSKFKISDRKEKHFYQQYTAIAFNGVNAYDAVTLRVYATDNKTYCCLWVHGNCSWDKGDRGYWRSGSGNAGGYGYHRGSAAACEAIYNAGIELSEDIKGRGDTAIEDAVEAMAAAMWKDAYIYVTKSNA